MVKTKSQTCQGKDIAMEYPNELSIKVKGQIPYPFTIVMLLK